MKKYRSGYGPVFQTSGSDESKPPVKDVLRYVLKETEWLWRQSVPTPCEAVQSVKALNRFKGVAKIYVQIGLLGLANTASGSTIQAFEKGLVAGFKIDFMTIEGQ